MKDYCPSNVKQIRQKPWLTTKDIYQIYPVGQNMARDMFNKAKEKAIKDNYYLPICRPPVVPTEVVENLFPIGK